MFQDIRTRAGVPEPMPAILADVDVSGIRRGLLRGGSGDLSGLIGRPTTPIAAGIAAALRG